MKTKLWWILLISVVMSGCGTSSPSQAADFPIEAYKSNRVLALDWPVEENESVESYIVYVEQGDSERFPKTKVVDLESNHWESTPRKTLPFFFQQFGWDIRDPSQWGDTAVLTPGEIYTVGVQKKLIDGRVEWAQTVIMPCEKTIASGQGAPSDLAPVELDQIHSLRSMIFTSRFVETKGDEILFEFHGNEHEIVQIDDDRYYYYLHLDNNDMVKCEKSPARPVLYGDETLINTIWRFQIICLAVLLIYMMYITGKAFYYLNFLAHEENNPKEVLKTILSEEKSSVLIIYAIVLITKNYFSNKLIRLVVAELVEGNKDLLLGIEKIFNSYRIYQYAQIRVSILDYLQ